MLPGWARDGEFSDPREYPYGPLPRDWAHYKGLYVHQGKVILSYTVGETEVLELPGIEGENGLRAFTRTLNLSPHDRPMVLQVCFEETGRAEVLSITDRGLTFASASLNETIATLRRDERKLPSARILAGQLRTGLAALWTFEDETGGASGATIVNTVGERFSGRAQGSHRMVQGKRGMAWTARRQSRIEIEDSEAFDFGSGDFTIAAWVRPGSQGGTILAKAPAEGDWAPGGKSFFIRDGRLVFDAGWVGDVQADREFGVDRWQYAAVTYRSEDETIEIYLDGERVGRGTLALEKDPEDHVIRIGFTSPDFPEPSRYRGALDDVRLYRRALSPLELAALAENEDQEDLVTAVAYVGETTSAKWNLQAEGHIRLEIPASYEPRRIKLLIWRGPSQQLAEFVSLARSSPPPVALEPLTHGGPGRWTEEIVTQGELGDEDGPYAIDRIPAPNDNPWNAWMRFGGFDFFTDESRAALGTWSGDVWTVAGIDESLNRVSWKRIATGLFQPLGLEIVDDEIYVLGRDQITRLHDFNGDGETDFYENFNNDHMVSEHFHEFALDLKLGPDGAFYYTKGARHAREGLHPQHGPL
ncbi:LamG domain-containing protein, partial [Candidatus Sumerlaeota bacterium]|nr:LamG domain-containing protein [Candidatus Sumerlaeota bacterium]